jgi:hypothetical protein
MNKRSLLILALIVLVSSALSFFMLTRGQLWWDDFASYLMQAKAILTGNTADFIQHNTFTIQNSSYPPGPVAYPWGYPLLLAPVVALFGLNTLALKLIGVAFYAVFLITFYFLAKTRLVDWVALLLTSLLAFNPSLLQANDQIISDIPFLAVSTLGIFLIDYLSLRGALAPKQSPVKQENPHLGRLLHSLTLARNDVLGLAIGATIFATAILRTNGILLLVPLAVALLISYWPDWKTALKRALPPGLTFAFLFVISSLLVPNGQDSYLSHFSMFNLPRLLDNILYYLWLPARTFELLPAGMIFYPILAVFLLVSIFSHWKRDLVIHAYSLATLGLFILWPERQGLRFIYPILPFLFIFACDGTQLAFSRIPTTWQTRASRAVTVLWGLLLILSLGISANMAYVNMASRRDINGPFDPVSYELYDFIRTKTPADSVIIFVRPRALRLFTNRDSFMTTECADLPKGDYVAIHRKMGNGGQIAPDQITACPAVTLAPVFKNTRFIVYRINP